MAAAVIVVHMRLDLVPHKGASVPFCYRCEEPVYLNPQVIMCHTWTAGEAEQVNRVGVFCAECASVCLECVVGEVRG